MPVRVVDLDENPRTTVGVRGLAEDLVVAHCSKLESLDHASAWADAAAFTLAEFDSDDPRVVTVDDVDTQLHAIIDQITAFPLAARICDDVLRANAAPESLQSGLIAESLAYSTLQAGPEFRRWLEQQPPRERHESSRSVRVERNVPDTLTLTFNRPEKHNAFSNALRAGLLDGLDIAQLDDSVRSCILRGAGRSFCSGGDLKEFGLFDNVAASHLARTRFSPAISLDAVARRLDATFVAEVHGAVMGSGLEMAAYCGTVRSDRSAWFGLPEIRLGLIPGAGGTVSLPRRIGRWRTSYLVLSGEVIDPGTALSWGLIDEVVESFE